MNGQNNAFRAVDQKISATNANIEKLDQAEKDLLYLLAKGKTEEWVAGT